MDVAGKALLYTAVTVLVLLSLSILTSFFIKNIVSEAEAAGRSEELRRYENEEVVCYSRHDRDSSIFCKWK